MSASELVVRVDLNFDQRKIREDIRKVISQDEFLNSSVSVMLKALGVALIGKICSDICKECGENGIAEGVEMLSGVVILSLSLPMLSKILSFASEILQRGS